MRHFITVNNTVTGTTETKEVDEKAVKALGGGVLSKAEYPAILAALSGIGVAVTVKAPKEGTETPQTFQAPAFEFPCMASKKVEHSMLTEFTKGAKAKLQTVDLSMLDACEATVHVRSGDLKLRPPVCDDCFDAWKTATGRGGAKKGKKGATNVLGALKNLGISL
jgi:hypothetical protein